MDKYTYIRKTITWQNRRYEVRGKTEQEACDKLAKLITSLKTPPTPLPAPPPWTRGSFSGGTPTRTPLRPDGST